MLVQPADNQRRTTAMHLFHSILGFLLLATLLGCDRDKQDQQVADNPQSQETKENKFEPDCTVTNKSKALYATVLRDDEQQCTVFLPKNITTGVYHIALSASSEKKQISAERKINAKNTLYATTGTADIQVEETTISGTVKGRDNNQPETGNVYIAIDIAR